MPNIMFPVENLDLWDQCVVHIADFDFKEGFHSKGRMRHIEWFYCISGRGHLRIEEKEYELHAGVMFQSEIGKLRELWCDDDARLKVIMVGCGGSKVADGFAGAMGGVNRCFVPTNGEAIFKIASAMLASAAAYEPLAMQICSQYLSVLWVTIRQGRLVEKGEEQDNFATYLKCKRYIDEHFRHIKHVDEVAYEVGISHEYMCRLYKRHAQTTPHAYYLLLKMNGAMHLLQHSDKPLKAIAFEHGFATASAFSKAFKRVMGVSPKFVRTGG